jgi:hypothetical protein
MRMALDDAAPLYRDASEAREAKASGQRMVQAFIREVLSKASVRTRTLAGALIRTTLSAVGKQFSELRVKPRKSKSMLRRWPTCSVPISEASASIPRISAAAT